MKRYHEYTTEELAAIDEAAIQRLIDIELANARIAPVPVPEPLTLANAGIERRVIAYRVGGLLFANEEDARQVSLMALLRDGYKWECGYDYRYVEPLIETAVETVSFYQKEDVLRASKVLQEIKARKEELERQQKEHDNYLKETSGFRNEVWQAVHAAREKMCRVDIANQTLHKYKDLADGDEEVAKNFFRNTYKEQPDMIKAVLGEEPEPDPEAQDQAAG